MSYFILLIAFQSFHRYQSKQPLSNMEFVIIGETERPKSDIEDKIRKMGGKVVSNVHKGTAAVISTRREVNKAGRDMRDVLLTRVQVITEDFIDEVLNNDPMEVFTRKNMNNRGKDVSLLTLDLRWFSRIFISFYSKSHFSCMNEFQNWKNPPKWFNTKGQKWTLGDLKVNWGSCSKTNDCHR